MNLYVQYACRLAGTTVQFSTLKCVPWTPRRCPPTGSTTSELKTNWGARIACKNDKGRVSATKKGKKDREKNKENTKEKEFGKEKELENEKENGKGKGKRKEKRKK